MIIIVMTLTINKNINYDIFHEPNNNIDNAKQNFINNTNYDINYNNYNFNNNNNGTNFNNSNDNNNNNYDITKYFIN